MLCAYSTPDRGVSIIASIKFTPDKPRAAWLRHLGLTPLTSLLLFAAAVYGAGLGQGDLRLDGSIYGWVAKHMAATGDLLTPYYDWGCTPYFNKPPLQFWIAAALCKLFGATSFAVKLSSFVFGMTCIGLTYRLARRMLPREGAALAGVVLVTTYTFQRNLIGFRLDAGITLFFLLAIEAALQLLEQPQGARLRLPWWLLGVAIGCGLMIKGGIVLLALPVVVAAFALAHRGDLLRNWSWLAVIAAAAAIALPWHLLMYGQWGDRFLDIYIGEQIMKRFEGTLHDAKPPTFYFRELASFYWPWLPAALVGGRLCWKHRAQNRPFVWLGLAWLLIYFLAIHLVRAKYDRYLMPLFPLLAIYAAVALSAWPAAGRAWNRMLPGLGVAAIAISLGLGLSGLSLHRVWLPELFAALPEMDAALAASEDPDKPEVYLHDRLHVRARCNVLFYSHELDARRYRLMGEGRWDPVSSGAFIIIDPADAAELEAHYPGACLLEKGRTVAIYRTVQETGGFRH